jgi:UDP-glucose:(heptosyl)LPS alpha-1,3-glucosyltransferase
MKRLAGALVEAGHECVLFVGPEWPSKAIPEADIVRVSGRSPRAFADGLEGVEPARHCDLLYSLERVWRCDAYRAGDGVHRAWLERRARREPRWKSWFREVRPHHRALVELEASLFGPEGARRIVANSHLVRREIESRFGTPSERITVVYNGVPAPPDLPQIARDRASVRGELGLAAGQYAVLFVGSGWERKGLAVAIRAIDGLRGADPVLLVAGNGKRRGIPPSRRALYLGTGLGVRRLYAAADAFVLPTWYDPFSNACLEAASFGLPVVTTAENGFAEVIAEGEEGNAIADPGDVGALASALEGWADPGRRRVAAERLRAKMAGFSVEANLEATLRALAGGVKN